MKTLCSTAFASGLVAFLCLCEWSNNAGAGMITFAYDTSGRLIEVDYGANITASYAYDNSGNLIQSSMPSQALSAGPIVNDHLTLSWPAAPSGFTLESTATLGPGADWQPVGATPVPNGNQLTVIVQVSGGTRFYRLRRP